MNRLLLFIFSLFILLTSCTKKEEKDPLKLLKRKWTLLSEKGAEEEFYLFLNTDKKGKNYFRYHLQKGDTVVGSWNFNPTTSLITLERTRTNPLQQKIDSIGIASDSTGTRVVLFNKDYERARIENGKIIEPEMFSEIKVDSLSSDNLIVSMGGKQKEFRYYPAEIKDNMSFTSILRGVGGIFILVLIGWLFSEKRKQINWRLILSGLIIQLIFAIGVLKVPFVESLFETVSSFFIKVISFTQEGTDFLFASFGAGEIESPLLNFVVMVLPTIIFFSALTSLLYYWGILQKIVYAFAWMMKKTMRLSGAESMAAAGNIFLGQTEAPLLVKPYLSSMTRSEIMCLMSGGMATIAGGVLAAYVGFLGGDDPQEQLYFAKHLLAASVMSAPAAIVAAKLLVPETEQINEEMTIPKDKIGSNALEAVTNGTTDGLKLAANVAAMLLVFIALMAMGNWILQDIVGELTGANVWIQEHTAYSGLTFQFLIGYAFSPIALAMGVPQEDMVLVGQLLGEKTILNEFYAYTTLGDLKASGAFFSEKSIMMATYILCGFANFASIGIQIGGIGSLAPDKKPILSQLGFRALIGGTLACLFTAVIVGMLM